MTAPIKPSDITRKIDLGRIESSGGHSLSASIEIDHNNRPSVHFCASESGKKYAFAFFHGLEEAEAFLAFVSSIKEKIEYLRDPRPVVEQEPVKQPEPQAMPKPPTASQSVLKQLFGRQ
jgi:hypothetical protein